MPPPPPTMALFHVSEKVYSPQLVLHAPPGPGSGHAVESILENLRPVESPSRLKSYFAFRSTEMCSRFYDAELEFKRKPGSTSAPHFYEVVIDPPHPVSIRIGRPCKSADEIQPAFGRSAGA